MRRAALCAAVVWCACTSKEAPVEAPRPVVEVVPKAAEKPPVAAPVVVEKVAEKPVTADPKAKAQLEAKMEKRVLAGKGAVIATGSGMAMGSASGVAMGAGGLGLRGIGAGGGGRGHFALSVSNGDADTGESYGSYGVNGWVETTADHLSTFAADVDTASYAIARRKLRESQKPPADSVRVEEFVNYFRYAYPQPEGALGVSMDVAPSPFSPGKHLLRVGVQGRRQAVSQRKPAHLTFLVDVSGSMQSPDKLPLAKRSLRLLVDNLRDGDTVALVTYAGSVRVVLPHTGLEKKALIHEAIEGLSAGGSTAMSSGIELAYKQALSVLDGQSTSRVVIVSDGDANVGATTHDAILALIAGHVKEGVTVTTVGFGMGNYKDDLMEQFANKGNGNHAYVDSMFEAKKVFQTELGSTLEVIAQDVKLQVDFDAEKVKRYRLVGYENRDIADTDFRNDKVDAGEIGSGHTVTALYEVELKGEATDGLCTVRIRAKKPRGSEAVESSFRFSAANAFASFESAPADLRFATAVMGAAEVFRQSAHAKTWSLEQIASIARSAAGDSPERLEFTSLVTQARPLFAPVAVR